MSGYRLAVPDHGDGAQCGDDVCLAIDQRSQTRQVRLGVEMSLSMEMTSVWLQRSRTVQVGLNVEMTCLAVAVSDHAHRAQWDDKERLAKRQ